MENKNSMLIVGVVVVVIIVATGIFMSRRTAPVAEQETTPAAESAPSGIMEASENAEIRTIEIEAGAFYFKPSEIRVKKGEKVKIVLKSVDMMHDFNVDDLGIKVPIAKSGETAEFEFTADKAGTYESYCSVGEHREKGQVGTLVVEE